MTAICPVPDLSPFPDGTSLADMAAALGMPIVAVRQVLEHGFVSSRGHRLGLDTDDVHALREAGWTQIAIAARFGCSESTVCRRLKKRGRLDAR